MNVLEDLEGLFGEYAFESALSKETAEYYWIAVRSLASYLEAQGGAFLDADRRGASEWLESMALSHAPATARGYLSGVRGFYSWLEARGLCGNPTGGLAVRNASGERRQPLDPDTAREILDAAEREARRRPDSKVAARDHAILCMMLRCFVRSVEISNADLRDYHDFEGRVILETCGFGSSSVRHLVAIDDATRSAVSRYLRLRGDSDPSSPLFASATGKGGDARLTRQGVRRVVKRAAERVGISSTDFSIGKTCLALAASMGATEAELREFARMRSWNMAMEAASAASGSHGDVIGVQDLVRSRLEREAGVARLEMTAGQLIDAASLFRSEDMLALLVGPDGSVSIGLAP